ncbi:hypothetical protein DRH13_02705, partial [Candidatus Woesebacteria bacterium]
SWFYPAMYSEMPGQLPVAPPNALKKHKDLRDSWLLQHPRLPKEAPMVSLGPGEENGRKGFIVKKVIVYKPQKG